MWGYLFARILARPRARRAASLALVVLTVILFMPNLRRQGERAARAAERLKNLEHANAIQRQMLDAASRRPRDRNNLLERLREGGF